MVDDPPVPHDRKRLVIIVVGLLIALNLGILAVHETQTNDQQVALPSAILNTVPVCGNVLIAQDAIGATLAAGYRGELTLDGVALPLDEYDSIALTQNEILWRPGPGKTFTQIQPGDHSMLITFEPTDPKLARQSHAFSCAFKVS